MSSTNAPSMSRVKGKERLNSDGQPRVNRSAKERSLALQRDEKKCVLTLLASCNPEVAHVLPYSMLNAPPGNSVLRGTTIDFWTVLEMFWTEDRVTKWRNAIFPSLDRPSIGVEACFNLILPHPNRTHAMDEGFIRPETDQSLPRS